MSARLLSVIALGGALTACWQGPANDAGHAAFVTEAMRVIEGRRPLSRAERDYLVDVATTHGREAVVDLMLSSDDFTAHWAVLMTDLLEVERQGRATVDACFSAERLDPRWDAALVAHLTTSPATAPFCPSQVVEPAPPVVPADSVFGGSVQLGFSLPDTPLAEVPPQAPASPDHTLKVPNVDGPELPPEPPEPACFSWTMRDLLRAAITHDRLDLVYQAYVIPFVARDPAPPLRATAQRFSRLFFNRDPECMVCHSTRYSTTNPRPMNGGFDRTWPVDELLVDPATDEPVFVDLEGSVFRRVETVHGQPVARPTALGGEDTFDPLKRFFKHGQVVPKRPLAPSPWGIADACVAGFADNDAAAPTLRSIVTVAGPAAAIADLAPSRTASALDLAALFQTAHGVTAGLTPIGWVVNQPHQSDGPEGSPVAACTGCHPTPGWAPELGQHVRGMIPEAIERTIKQGSAAGYMTARNLTAAEVDAAVAYLYAQQPPVHRISRGDVAALALVAMNLTERVYRAVTGASLTVDHGQPRTAPARDALASLTEAMRAGGGWSLRRLLKAIVLSGAFARRAPADTSWDPASGAPDPDDQPLLANVWAYTAASDSMWAGNTQGDWVHRPPTVTTLRTLAQALGWPTPPAQRRNRSAVPWPSDGVMAALGRHRGERRPEAAQVTLETLLGVDQQIGACRKPSTVSVREVELAPGAATPAAVTSRPADWVDYIDQLGALDLPLRHAAVHLKFRLLGEDWLTPEEEVALSQVVPNFAGRRSNAGPLRKLCGVWVQSPQFLLAGLPPEGRPGDAIELGPLGCVGTLCTQQAVCDRYEGRLLALGLAGVCEPTQGPVGLGE